MSVESNASSGQRTGTTAKVPMRLPASAGAIVFSGTSSIPPVALAIAAKHCQLTSGPIPKAVKLIRLVRRIVSTRRNSAVSAPAKPGPSPI